MQQLLLPPQLKLKLKLTPKTIPPHLGPPLLPLMVTPRIRHEKMTQLTLMYMSAMLFFDQGGGAVSSSTEWLSDDWGGPFLIGLNALVLGLVAISIFGAVGNAVRDVRGAVHSLQTGKLMQLPPTPPEIIWHLFLSHVWSTGQDSARVIKERLKQQVPGVSIFLDVRRATFRPRVSPLQRTSPSRHTKNRSPLHQAHSRTRPNASPLRRWTISMTSRCSSSTWRARRWSVSSSARGISTAATACAS